MVNVLNRSKGLNTGYPAGRCLTTVPPGPLQVSQNYEGKLVRLLSSVIASSSQQYLTETDIEVGILMNNLEQLILVCI